MITRRSHWFGFLAQKTLLWLIRETIEGDSFQKLLIHIVCWIEWDLLAGTSGGDPSESAILHLHFSPVALLGQTNPFSWLFSNELICFYCESMTLLLVAVTVHLRSMGQEDEPETCPRSCILYCLPIQSDSNVLLCDIKPLWNTVVVWFREVFHIDLPSSRAGKLTLITSQPPKLAHVSSFG